MTSVAMQLLIREKTTLPLSKVDTLLVGRISQRGEQKGWGRFGGSTVVLLAQCGRIVFAHDLVASSQEGMDEPPPSGGMNDWPHATCRRRRPVHGRTP